MEAKIIGGEEFKELERHNVGGIIYVYIKTTESDDRCRIF